MLPIQERRSSSVTEAKSSFFLMTTDRILDLAISKTEIVTSVE